MNKNEFFQTLEARPWEHDFYQTLRRLDCLHADRPRLGEALRPVDEVVRLGQDPALDFAPASLSALHPREGLPPRLEQRFFGLLGPNGPLPLHLTEYARERLHHHGDATLARFLDVFHHRLLALFYRAWAQAQPTVSLDRPSQDHFALRVGALAGLGSPTLQKRDPVGESVKLYFSGWLSRQVRNRDGLESLLAGYFRLPTRVKCFVGHWLRLPESDRTRLGPPGPATRLGQGALLGSAVWDRQHKIRLHLGPMTLAQYEDFLPGGRALVKLLALVRQYLGLEFEWDVRLVLAAPEVPPLRLGGCGRLGWTTWLGGRPAGKDAADLVLDAEQWSRQHPETTLRDKEKPPHG